MKTLNELYAEVIASDSLKAEFLALKTPEEIVAFAKKYGCDATLDDIKTFFEEKQKSSGELSEEDLEQVAGGKSANGDEMLISICGPVVCMITLYASIFSGRVGTAIKGEGMLCAMDEDKDSVLVDGK